MGQEEVGGNVLYLYGKRTAGKGKETKHFPWELIGSVKCSILSI